MKLLKELMWDPTQFLVLLYFPTLGLWFLGQQSTSNMGFFFFFFKDWISCSLKCLKNIFVLLEWWNMPLVLCLRRQRQEALIETEANWSN